MTAVLLGDPVLDELRAVLGDDGVLVDKPARYCRTRVPAPFPVHRWDDHVPSAVVLPRTTDEVVGIVEVANRHRVPIVPRAAGTGLADGEAGLVRVAARVGSRVVSLAPEEADLESAFLALTGAP